ncbi:hypothetical protein BJX66DRAFT_341006 [Aspergillus keveii]|uniref:Uncharacterized protein n=1 Tax=Aspergillus keveii TaxID=714993 RepID=A0ABR4FWR4_9EURO
MSPFVRARVPELELLHKISSHELIVFIDQLNEAFMAKPTLQAANTAANVGGMAPSMIVQLVSVSVNVAAGVGASVTTKMRTKKYLAKANDELFHPWGLHVQMCKTDKMLEYAGLGGQENVFVRRRYEEAFHDAQRVPIVGPMGPSPSESCSHPIMQRMSSLGDRVMVLSFDGVENATMPDGFWKKWGAKEARKAEQKQYEMMKDQQTSPKQSFQR